MFLRADDVHRHGDTHQHVVVGVPELVLGRQLHLEETSEATLTSVNSPK